MTLDVIITTLEMMLDNERPYVFKKDIEELLFKIKNEIVEVSNETDTDIGIRSC